MIPDSAMTFHRLLLRVCGRAPDELVVLARHWLAENWLIGVAKMLAFAAQAGHFAITESEARLLATTLSDAGEDWSFVADLPRTGREEPLPFTAVGDAYFGLLDFAQSDDVDQTAVATAAATGAVCLWRAWRLPSVATLYPPPKRLYLLQVGAGVDPVDVAFRMQAALAMVGEAQPLIEVFDDPGLLPEFSRRALERADLLWADRPAKPLRLAATFDTFDADGSPAFTDDRPRLSEPESGWVAVYLASGLPLLSTGDRVPDLFDPARGKVVPIGLRGDGDWVWSDAAGYYLNEYGIAPDPLFLDTIRAAGYAPPALDAVAAHHCRKAFEAGLGTPVRHPRPRGR